MKFLFPVTLCAVLGCGLMAGLFFAFSVCVMKALGQLPPGRGIAAMQSINAVIQNPIFFLVFFVTAAACGCALVLALAHRHAPGAGLLLAASALYLIGGLLVTIVVNVPLNESLAAAHPDSPEGARLWAAYLSHWTVWNHVRTLASLAATTLFALALRHPSPV